MMSVKFSPTALDEFFYLAKRDKRIFKALVKIIEDTQRNGIGGLGHSEQLSGNLSGWWSKRLDEANRMVFRIENDTVIISKCYTHYGDK